MMMQFSRLPQSVSKLNLLRTFASSSSGSRSLNVNKPFVPNQGTFPTFSPKDNKSKTPNFEKYSRTWTGSEVEEAVHKNSVYSWGASDPLHKLAFHASRSEGCYIYDTNGKKVLDWSSGAVCTNLGHSVPQQIIDAVAAQMKQCAFVYGDLTYTDARAKLCSLLAEITPGDINGFYLASGGAEANEAAMRIARRFTGRQKILSRYRSYHGGTSGTIVLTGDFRRWYGEPAPPGFVKIMEPFPLSHYWDDKDPNAAIQRCLDSLHDQIIYEGPHTIAAIFLEPVTGANGWLRPPTKYMQGVRALCDKYGILMVSDEVMTGFGRCGHMFGFELYDGVLPDMITFAKGITSSYIPLSGVGVRDHIFNFFRENPLGIGSTYFAHPVACAAGIETIKYLIQNDIIGHVRKMEPVMMEVLSDLVDKHPCVKQARCTGLGAGFDLGDKNGNFLSLPNENHQLIPFFRQKLLDNGLSTLIRAHHVHCAPPLIINEAEIREGGAILSKALSALDDAIIGAK